MQDLNLGLLQADLYWHNPEANRAMMEEMLWQLEEKVDVVILPEMFTTGFTMEADKWAEPMNLHTFKWMKQMAAQLDALVLGSFIVKDRGGYYNRLLWMQPDGDYATYDKRHLFRMAKEDQYYQAGNQVLIRNWRGWNICPMICYDLRFPVWSRNVNLTYDVLIYIANWPSARIAAWDVLLQARAIENLSYAVGVNRIGEDGMGIPYNGHSAVCNPKGSYALKPQMEAGMFTAKLSGQMLKAYRQKFPAHHDADRFNLEY